jgi:phosphatidate cytidylyltransferase
MLIQRIVTAVLLLAILLPAMFARETYWFLSIALLLMALGAWEWARLNQCASSTSYGMGFVCMGLCFTAWVLGLHQKSTPAIWVLLGGAWVLAGAWLLKLGVAGWAQIPQWLRLVGGLLALSGAWLAVAQARELGINFLLSILALVWIADIFAYFTGRALGQHKLAPGISPGKSWEGVWGGMTGVLLLSVVWIWIDQTAKVQVLSFYSHLNRVGWWAVVMGGFFMASMSVLGDLVESLVKRSAGAKDSSKLLPGHGGVLDRVDALLPTLPVAMMLLSLLR